MKFKYRRLRPERSSDSIGGGSSCNSSSSESDSIDINLVNIGTDIDDSTGSISTGTSDTQIPLPCRTTRLSSRRRGMFFYYCIFAKIQISLGVMTCVNLTAIHNNGKITFPILNGYF